MKKRILINLLSFSEEKYYGVGVYFRDVAIKSINRVIEELECEISILYLAHIPIQKMFTFSKNENIKYIPVKKINSKLTRVFYEQIMLPLYHRDYDVIYSPNNINPLILAFSKKSIITIHDLLPFKRKNRFSLLQRQYLKLFTYLSAKFAYKIITVSNYSKMEIMRLLGTSGDKVIVTYNTLPNIHIENPSINCWINCKYFFSVGALQSDKQYDLMIKAFYKFIQMDEQYKDYKLLIAGGDLGAKKSLCNLIDEFNLSGKVILLGYISELEKNSLYSSCTASLLLGKSEGFGIPVIESMFHNKPVIVSDLGALPEIVGDAGIVVNSNLNDLTNAMVNVCNLNLSEKVFKHELDRFESEKQIECLTSVIKKAIS